MVNLHANHTADDRTADVRARREALVREHMQSENRHDCEATLDPSVTLATRSSPPALGPVGLLLGWTPLLRAAVRRKAAARLEAFGTDSK